MNGWMDGWMDGYGAIKQIKLREADRRQAGQDEFDIVCDKSNGPSFWICKRPNNRQIVASLDVELTDSGGRILRRNNVITNLDGNQEFDFGTNFESIDDDEDKPSPITKPVTTPSESPVSQPVTTPTNPPVEPLTPTVSPAPTPESSLLSTDKAMNAWDVYLGLDYITHSNSENPPNYALVAS